jgi:hypothetical protein
MACYCFFLLLLLLGIAFNARWRNEGIDLNPVSQRETLNSATPRTAASSPCVYPFFFLHFLNSSGFTAFIIPMVKQICQGFLSLSFLVEFINFFVNAILPEASNSSDSK